eukprot:scaffold127026_cov60-Phaeocystis_antarctica.AAC.2
MRGRPRPALQPHGHEPQGGKSRGAIACTRCRRCSRRPRCTAPHLPARAARAATGASASRTPRLHSRRRPLSRPSAPQTE